MVYPYRYMELMNKSEVITSTERTNQRYQFVRLKNFERFIAKSLLCARRTYFHPEKLLSMYKTKPNRGCKLRS